VLVASVDWQLVVNGFRFLSFKPKGFSSRFSVIVRLIVCAWVC